MSDSKNWLPKSQFTDRGHIRRVGVEIELAKVDMQVLEHSIQALYDGTVEEKSAVESAIRGTKLGDFMVELDASYMKALADQKAMEGDVGEYLQNKAIDLLTKTAELVVPWEVVSPPIDMSDLHRLDALIHALREAGAEGTRSALHYAFGVHLNPELPDLNVATILRYVRAYFCLYEWIAEQEKIDTTRKLTTYIKHFPKSYIRLVCDPEYAPSQDQLIDDYLEYNPTRNRSLDLLPLFAELDEKRVRAVVDDPRIKSRPTFHYRLPNCDIDNQEWSLFFPWQLWLQVETLAEDQETLIILCSEYCEYLSKINHPFDMHWVYRIDNYVQSLGLAENNVSQ